MEEEKPKERSRPTFWMWGQPTTVRNPIRERWERLQQEKARKQFEKFLKERDRQNG